MCRDGGHRLTRASAIRAPCCLDQQTTVDHRERAVRHPGKSNAAVFVEANPLLSLSCSPNNAPGTLAGSHSRRGDHGDWRELVRDGRWPMKRGEDVLPGASA